MQAADLPAGLAWATSAPDEDRRALFPVESRAIAKAVPSRKAEFAGGRIAARAALDKLGCAPVPIAVGEGRAPVWPKGFTGSITHTDDMCLAIVGRTAQVRSIGINLDRDSPLPADVIREVALSSELPAGGDLALAARRLFSAKEALFKAQYPMTGAFIGFHAMVCDLQSGVARFTDHDENKAIPAWLRQAGLPLHQWVENGLILSVSVVPADFPTV